MGCWWIDEVPYPGPDDASNWTGGRFSPHHSDWFVSGPTPYGISWADRRSDPIADLREAMKIFGSSAHRVGKTLRDEFMLINGPSPVVAAEPAEPPKEETPKERALRLKQSRSTGPNSPKQFRRDGRRMS